MTAKHVPITHDDFRLLTTTGNWSIEEVPREHWSKIPGLQRLEDTVAVMASGSFDASQCLNGIEAIAAFDVLVRETKRMAEEPEGNAYHYVVQRTSREDWPFIIHGPFKAQTIVPHWYEADDLDRYWQD